MRINNVKSVMVDAECNFPMSEFGKSDISFDNEWIMAFTKDKIIILPKERVKSIIIEKDKDTIIKP